MFARFAIVSAFFFAASAIASPAVIARGGGSDSQCNTGSVQCCDSVQNASSPDVTGLAGLLGIVLSPITGQVGLGCTPITVIGTGTGANCAQQPVCCENNNYNGLINLGCSPLNINA
ncbi:hydrophobin 2 [Hygrophoropsis aurantiaca]|uniref:Hydrophobin 2 n=1 Tax=Hygrophoropsis aurantiaca TaxID=72124 RepID=A0ACB8A2F4_9AGAM|nr:hydrophobin 2 [Hygrophoropsis aurantiaca]